MKDIYKKELFDKHIFVNDYNEKPENTFEVLFSLAQKLNIKITKGKELADLRIFEYAVNQFGIRVPQPFYKGFPQSVRELTTEQLLFDQLLHYLKTYGFDDFTEAGESLFEEQFERIAFKEKTTKRDFVILNEAEALVELENIMKNLLLSSRPLSDIKYLLLRDYITTYNYKIEKCACKETLIRLLLDTKDLFYANFLFPNDIIKFVEYLNYTCYSLAIWLFLEFLVLPLYRDFD